MIAGQIEIQLMADIARLRRDMDQARQVVTRATESMSRAAEMAKNALASIGGGIGLGQIVRMADEYAKFTAQLRLASQSAREYSAAYADVKRISRDAQQDLQATGVLYARIANGTRELGTTQKQVAAITETVNMALKVSGATAAESASAQLQLSQAFASGTLRGEEFNAVNEAAPRLMLALADGIGVPVGALKKMAEEGQITSKIMSDVLPNALTKLREEAKEVQTIAGAFAVLKNNVMEFVGIQAQANGVVAALTGGIGLLANNLGLLAGAMLTIGAAKLGNALAAWVTTTYQGVAASAALRAATIASTEAEVANAGAKVAQLGATQAMLVVAREEAVAKLAGSNANIASARTAIAAAQAAGAQSFALRTVRLATIELTAAEAARAAMLAELAILGRQQVSISAQMTAAQAAQAAAQNALNASTVAGAGAAGLLSRAIGFLGGPVGAVITLLGIGATAWAVWGNKATESEKQIAATLAEETDGYIASLQRQIDKLKERNELAGKGMVSGAAPATEDDKKREAVIAEINRVANDATLDVAQKTEVMRVWGARLNTIDQDIARRAAEQATAKDIAFTSKYAEWLGKNGNAAQKMTYELEELRKEFGRVTPEMEAWVKAKHADKGAAALKQEQTAYQSLVASIGEKIAANKLELSGYDKLSESQRMTIKLDEAIAAGKNKLSAAHIKEARDLLATLATQEGVIESQKRAAKGAEEIAKLWKEWGDTSAKSIANAEKEAERNEELAKTFGMTKSAIEQLEVARLEEQLAQRASTGLTLDEIEHLEKLIDAKKRSAAALGSLESMEATKKAAEQAVTDWKRSAEQIGQSLTDNIMRGGKSAAEYLKDLFRTLVLRPILAPIGNAVGAMATSAFGIPGGAQAATGGTDPVSMAVNASNVYKSISQGFAGIENSVSKGVESAFGQFGPGTIGGTGPGAASQMAGTAAGYFAGAAAGIYGGRAISNGYGLNGGSGNTAVNIGTIAGAILGGPIGAAIGGMIGGLANRAFGHKAREITSTTLNGNFGANGFTGSTDSAWMQKGGWFRSDKSGVDKVGIDSEVAKQYAAAYDAMKLASADFAKVLGINADAIKDRAQSMSIALGKDEEANKKAIADFFIGVGDSIAKELLPSLADFTKEGESASATLQRLATNYAALDASLGSVGMSFGMVGVESLAARERLVSLSGGIESFAQGIAGFAQNFLTEDERRAPVIAAVSKAMAELGHASVDTREEFKALFLSLDPASESTSKLFAELVKLQGAFAEAYPSTEQLNAALAEQAAAQKAAADAARQAVRDNASSLLGSVDNAFSVLQRVIEGNAKPLRDRIEAERALSSAIRSTLDSMKVAGAEMADRAAAQAQIRTALAIAKAGGPLPDAEALRKALSTVSQDASAQFATQQDYLRDFYQTQNDIAALGDLADSALSVDEKSLNALTSMLDSAQRQVDLLKGIDTSALTVAQAMAGLQTAILSAQANPVVSATSAINSAYQSALGRAPDAAGLSYWQDRAASGASSSAIVDAIKSSPEAMVQSLYQSLLGRSADAAGLDYWLSSGLSVDAMREAIKANDEYKTKLRIPGFVNGGDHIGGLRAVGEAGIEIEATGPSRIHSTRDLIENLRNPSQNNAALAAAVDRLNATVARQEAIIERQSEALEQTQRNTKRLADGLEVVTDGFNAIRTKQQEPNG
jgi:tape measure domain-containing protein